MKPKITITIGTLLLFILFSSCASIRNGTKQAIRINSLPQGANVLINGKDLQLKTPCMVELKRKVKPGVYNNRNEYRFLFQKEGYANFEVIDYRKINPTIYWNVATWLFVVFAVPIDFASGAAYKYSDNIYAELQSLNPGQNEDFTKKNITAKQKDKLPPKIKVITPDLDRGFKPVHGTEKLIVTGIAEDESGISEVIINNISATVIADGSFEAEIPLQMGRNKISITATDNHMNVATESFYIERNDETSQNTITENIDTPGKYYAFIIGIKDYTDPAFNDLEQPVDDARRLYKTLTTLYQFDSTNIVYLENPGKEEITDKLEYFYNKLSKQDNLLIFYAGHGYWDQKFKQGYWIPSDAKEYNRGTWLSNSTLRDYIRAIPAKHELLITDACFAGAIFKSRDAFTDASKAINQLYELPSRKAMTSGALNTVPDKSVFLQYLIKRLEDNQQKYLSAEQLFSSFKLAVINNSPENQVPQYGEVKETGDEGGDFIFIRR